MLRAEHVIQMAVEFGFDLVGFASAGPAPRAQAFLDWLNAGYAGEMHYLERSSQRRLDPRMALPGARTVVVVGVSYETLAVREEILRDPSRGRIARYAWGADYHDVITPRLRAFGERLSQISRAYVDTGPVLERAWAERSGLGFIGRNTCLIHRSRGSYLFLGAVLLGEEIEDAAAAAPFETMPDPMPFARKPKFAAGCGQCTRCLTACPTQAFVAPGKLDARRCISYLTIELKGSIPVEFRPLMGNWIFGCDICQDVCPYVRRYSAPTRERAFYPPGVERAAPKLLDILSLDRYAFNARFKGTPLMRAKWVGVLRNACVACGNWRDPDALPVLRKLLNADESVLQEHAAWAISRIEDLP